MSRPANQTADITNVDLMHATTLRLLGRPAGSDGMAVLYGPSGFGKTQAATQAYLRHNGYFVRMSDQWTCKTFLQKILIEMDIQPEKTGAAMLDQVAQQLSASSRPLIIDEADYAADKPRLVQLIRDIHDNSYKASIILVGEEALPQKLAKWERFHSRVLDWVPAQPVSLDDARKLVPIYSEDMPVADDLLQLLVDEARGSVRRVGNNLNLIREEGLSEGWDVATLANWGNRTLYTGKAPTRRLP
ncbi:DNA transposition protein [Aquitalea magnusonii]|uniref:DNA transposition protein n=1 Tax=Aquitalea magnusonii TaxID=332411 RepID=A0A3G9GE88_9NEIS|nr:ATP-binding protein [Aquitalea magnusonii]BBF84412.1 DNA transposition protein [Aquitalea magnusonii]